jgi:thiosulfate/3-mercaptopyruvate sulfurtransferase
MSLKIDKPLVSVDWLFKNLNNENLIVLDASIPKVIAKIEEIYTDDRLHIKGAIFFDIKNSFSDLNAVFPNTILSPKKFEESAQKIGINKDSCIVVYDDFGIYSSPRVWWMFQLMGFKNIAILDGGFPAWESEEYPTEKPQNHCSKKGNFIANYQKEKIKFTKDLFSAIKNESILIADARSKGRFYATEPEPRIDVKRGHIPNSVSMPYFEIVENGKLKSEQDLKKFFNTMNPKKKEFIFSCGTGITASVLALGAELSGLKNYAVYDGSWTEWGSTDGLPIER